jgi:Fe-S cluster assembly iron-binding protein IscA
MLTITEKAADFCKSTLEKSAFWSKVKKDGGKIFVRLGIIEEREDYQYSLEYVQETDPDDLTVNFKGLQFIYDKESAPKLDNATMDFFQDDNVSGLNFNRV